MINNLSFKLKDIYKYRIPTAQGKFYGWIYNLDNDYMNGSDGYDTYNFIEMFQEVNGESVTGAIDTSTLTYYNATIINDILSTMYYKYYNYNIAFNLPSEFITELCIKIKKVIYNLSLKQKYLNRLYNIDDKALKIIENEFVASSYNNAYVNNTNMPNDLTGDNYLNNMSSYINEQNGRRRIKGDFNSYINALKNTQDYIIKDIIDEMKSLFVRVIPNEKYLYLED